MTTLEEERTEQARWRLRPGAPAALFEALLSNEFEPQADRARREAGALGRLLRWAAGQVPHYRDAFAAAGVTPADVPNAAALARLPILTKLDVQRLAARLRPRALPDGERAGGISESSGTSGRQRTRVVHTQSSLARFACLKQRELRWFRFDPGARLAWIRLASQMGPGPDGRPLRDGATLRRDGWPGLDAWFETGPFAGCAVTTPVDAQVAWLADEQPAYLMAYAESLEHLAFAWGERAPPEGLDGLLAISEQVTPGLRAKVEGTFGVPLHENYGLNEVGVVATRCPEGGRFHVHTEACVVEIVDDDGQPVAPGETGRLLVTVLVNPAMPLVRYDTGDLARATDGPCPCGRTLPGIDGILGRYSRIAYLPEGTLAVAGAVREAIERAPPAEVAALREFQLHQDAALRYTLRLAGPDSPDVALAARVQAAFEASRPAAHGPLEIVCVAAIARSPGGKFQDFVSDFMPGPDDATPAACADAST